MILALAMLAVIAIAAAILARRTTISVIIRKDTTDMATIKERLAAIEAAQAAHSDALAGVAQATDVTALAGRVDAIDAEIGTDAPAPAPTLDPATGLPA